MNYEEYRERKMGSKFKGVLGLIIGLFVPLAIFFASVTSTPEPTLSVPVMIACGVCVIIGGMLLLQENHERGTLQWELESQPSSRRFNYEGNFQPKRF